LVTGSSAHLDEIESAKSLKLIQMAH
jgi:hypothetical protein